MTENSRSRPYDARCPMFRAANVFGDPCNLLILRDLFRDGPRNFNQFRASDQGFSSRTLSLRLASLVDAGFIQKTEYQKKPVRHLYALTAEGEKLGPVMAALYEWGGKQS